MTQPRLPCFKLAAKFQRQDIIKRFLDSGRTGFYVRVLKEGALQAGDAVEVLVRDSHRLTIREITSLYSAAGPQRSELIRALSVEALSDAWRQHFEAILAQS